ncbi:MAG TPA: hypothetical protein DEP36_08310 [Gammaproteobacteria bacterium]|mgnify:CR=1 FL=1|nr:hypothetical protein [Gammaproteobacteria bacterium]
MFEQSLSLSAIIAQLRKLCEEKQTGLLYAIENGHFLGQIGLHRGEIVFLKAQKMQGTDAIPVMLGIENGSMAFTKGVSPPARMVLPPTADLLALFEGTSPAAPVPTSAQASSHVPLTATAKTIVEQTLKEFIGPIADLICADHFRSAVTLAPVIEALADEIPDPQSATQFRERVRQRLNG